MSVIRPEVSALFWRWREVIGAGVLAAFGLWLADSVGWVLQALGGAIAVLALAGGVLAERRVRFALGGGPGVVEVVEGLISYFGPRGGGVVGLSSLALLEFDPRTQLWLLHHADGGVVTIPASAEGADELFDAFSALPGLSSGALLSALAARHGPRLALWRSGNSRCRLS